jgi:hypothetical protein
MEGRDPQPIRAIVKIFRRENLPVRLRHEKA